MSELARWMVNEPSEYLKWLVERAERKESTRIMNQQNTPDF